MDAADAGPVLTPPDIFGDDLTLWLDADDVTTFNLDDGGYVKYWRNKVDLPDLAGLQANPMTLGIQRVQSGPNGRYAVRVGPANGTLGPSGGGLGATLWVLVAAYVNPRGVEGELAGPSMLANTPLPNLPTSEQTKIILLNRVGELDSARGGWNDGRFHSFGARSTDEWLALRTDGDDVRVYLSGGGAGTGLELGGEYVSLDGGPKVDRALDGLIAEYIVVHALRKAPDGNVVPIDGQEEQERVTQLSRYLQWKYGIPF